MKHVLFFSVFILLIGLTAFGQKKSKRSATSDLPDPADLGCVYQPKYSADARICFYPFTIADTVKLVSFRHHVRNYPIKGNSVVKDSLIETVVLKKAEVDLLTDIFYNNYYKTKTGISVIAQCYEPRNAILFINKEGELREYILICFHCDRYELGSSKQNALGDECSDKAEKLRKFFITKGIQFGTDRSIKFYSGETNKDPGIPPLQNY